MVRIVTDNDDNSYDVVRNGMGGMTHVQRVGTVAAVTGLVKRARQGRERQ